MVRHYVNLNDPGKANGVFQLWVNGKQVMAASDVIYRTTGAFDRMCSSLDVARLDHTRTSCKFRLNLHFADDMTLKGFLFSTFYGGDSKWYAPPSDQSCYFKDIVIY
jgi:hypothetical protein